MANNKLPTQADLKAAMDIINRWSKDQAPLTEPELPTSIAVVKEMPDSGDIRVTLLKQREAASGLVPPGVHVDVRSDFGVSPDFQPGLVLANSWGDPDHQPMSSFDLSDTHSIFAVDRKPNPTFAEVAASVDSIKATLKEHLPVPQQRPYVTNVQLTYEEQQFDGISRHASYGSGRVRLNVEMILPPDVNPNDYVELLKTLGDTGMPLPPSPSPSQRNASAETERQLTRLRNLIDQYKRDVERLQEEANTHKETLLRLRQRMNMAMETREDPEIARELFAELVVNWASKLVEGATFTAAEGDELVQALVASLEYMDLARETRRLEREELRSSSNKDKLPDDHLF
jgi:hypothetical protein